MNLVPAYSTFRLKKRSIWLHLFFWSLYILYELFFIYYTQGKFSPGSVFKFLIYYVVNITVFYSQLYLLGITFQNGRNYLKGFMMFLFQFILVMLAKAVLDILYAAPVSSFKDMLNKAKIYLFFNAFRSAYFCILATFYWIAGNIEGYRKKAAVLEKRELVAQKDQAELEARFAETRNAYLQQQLNPHLLFNSLSFIYSSVYAHSNEASRCVLLLSDIMRFSLDSSSGDGKAYVSAEIEQVTNLIELNRYRFKDKLYLRTRFDHGKDEQRIIPLVLLTLTENLFKHGFMTDPACPALLEIVVGKDGRLTYQSWNRKQKKRVIARSNSIGLQNTRIRLDHSYPGLYQLDISEDEYFFELKLTLPL